MVSDSRTRGCSCTRRRVGITVRVSMLALATSLPSAALDPLFLATCQDGARNGILGARLTGPPLPPEATPGPTSHAPPDRTFPLPSCPYRLSELPWATLPASPPVQQADPPPAPPAVFHSPDAVLHSRLHSLTKSQTWATKPWLSARPSL